jgi:hypothetical protein
MTPVKAMGMGESPIILTMELAHSTREEVVGENTMTSHTTSSELTPSFRMKLMYDIDAPEQGAFEQKSSAETKKATLEEPSHFAKDALIHPTVSPQMIAGLRNKLIQANEFYRDPQLQTSILVNALGNTQTLIKEYLNTFENTTIPTDAAACIADLGKIHGQIMQSLAGIAASYSTSPAMQTVTAPPQASTFIQSPFLI